MAHSGLKVVSSVQGAAQACQGLALAVLQINFIECLTVLDLLGALSAVVQHQAPQQYLADDI